MCGYHDVVKFLLGNRADPNIADIHGMTPILWLSPEDMDISSDTATEIMEPPIKGKATSTERVIFSGHGVML